MFRKDSSRGSVRFVLACAVVLLLGCALRLHPWQQPAVAAPPVQASAAQPGLVPVAEAAAPVQVLHTLMDFYDRLDRGRYSELYDTVIESKWRVLPDGTCAFAGLVPRAEFIAELGKEFDVNGASIIVMSHRMTAVSLVPDIGAAGSASPELAMLAHLPQDLQLKEVYQLRVEGDLGPACLPVSWSKGLYVAHFAPDDWRVLLADSAEPATPRKSQWFGEGITCSRP